MPESFTLIPAASRAGKPRDSGHVQDLRLFERAIRNQAKIYVWMQDRWIRKIREVEALADENERNRAVQGQINDMRDDLRDMGIFFSRCAPAMIAAKKARKELRSAIPVEQLEAQLAAELAKAAPQFTDEEWNAMVKAREKAKAA